MASAVDDLAPVATSVDGGEADKALTASPMAFTINFDDDGAPKKKAPPNKRFLMPRQAKNAPAAAPAAPPAAGMTKEANGIKGKTMTRDGPKFLEPRDTRVDLVNNNSSKIAAEVKVATVMPSAKKPQPAHNHTTLTRQVENNCDDRPESEAGTYTIDLEENDLSEEREQIEEVFGVSEQQNVHEWVSQWAATSPNASVDMNNGKLDPSSSLESETSRSRRKLPATPDNLRVSPNQANGAPKRNETETYLQDTITAMANMEARLDSSAEAEREQQRGSGRRPHEMVSAVDERRLNLERRKKYDPMRHLANSSPRGARVAPGVMSKSGYDSYSDTCSEMEQSMSMTSHDESNSKYPSASKPINSTRTNRAFALRKKLNSETTADPMTRSAISQPSTPRSTNMSRSDGGRFSLRSKAAKEPVSVKPKTVAARTVSGIKPGRGGEGRSSSSLSSREANFQAWKRRKNYNPLRSAGMSASPAPSAATPSASNVPSHKTAEKKKTSVSSADPNPMLRSASFHYPDGMSKVRHNVYTSEDESPEEFHSGPRSYTNNWSNSDLYEVNEDEFFLPIGGGPSPTRSAAARNRGSKSGNNMEALDNLVISTIYSISTKLCLQSAALVRGSQSRVQDAEQHSVMETLVRAKNNTCPTVM